MKAITLHQPWASLVALGVKSIETRSWSTTYRGPLVIHAGLRIGLEDGALIGGYILDGDTIYDSDGLHGDGTRTLLPLGAIVATCTLVDVVPMVDYDHPSPRSGPLDSLNLSACLDILGDRLTYWWHHDAGFRDVSDQRPYGDFAPGRYAHRTVPEVLGERRASDWTVDARVRVLRWPWPLRPHPRPWPTRTVGVDRNRRGGRGMSDEGRVDATRERGELCPCRTAPSREAAMVVLSDKVWCDPCIAPLVKALNDGGIPTVASCCGHGEQDGSIVLADGHELVIRTFTPFDGVLYEQESDRSRVFLDRLAQVEAERDGLREALGRATP